MLADCTPHEAMHRNIQVNSTNGPHGRRTAAADEICAWFTRKRNTKLDKDRVAETYFTFHPRTAFLKTLAPCSEVVDIGAGDGSLSVFRSWPEPNREDLRFYAYSLEKGRLFDDFSGYEISDWNLNQPEFDGKHFDAIVCAHFIEHIQDPVSLVNWAARKLNSGGRVYLEWPSVNSLSLPSRTELEALGVPLIISRFDDDSTHRALPDGDLIAAAMRDNGFVVESRGIVRLPWLEDELLGHHKESAEGFYRQAAFWSHTGWSQYIVAELTEPDISEPAAEPLVLTTLDQSPQAEIASLRHSLAVLQAEHIGSLSGVRALENKLSMTHELFAEERQRMTAEVAEKLALLADMEKKKLLLSANLEELRQRHEQILGSRSWKLTGPLRNLAKWLRGL